MANKIKIKRGAFSNIPTSFDDGEFGWANDDHKLFIGDGTGKHEVLMKNEYNATSFLYATTAATPENKTPAEVLEILSGEATANFSINNKKLISLADPTEPQDAVNLRTMQAAQAGLIVKPEVRVATTETGELAIDFAPGKVVDGVTLAAGNRILVKNQTNKVENGIYVVTTEGPLMRATDFNDDADVAYGAFTFVQEGDTYADTGWVLSTDGTIVIDTTELTFVQFAGIGSYTAGDGIDITGKTIKVTDELVWDKDFTIKNSILKADNIGQPEAMLVDINSVVGRVEGTIKNIGIDTSNPVGDNLLLHTESVIDGGDFS